MTTSTTATPSAGRVLLLALIGLVKTEFMAFIGLGFAIWILHENGFDLLIPLLLALFAWPLTINVKHRMQSIRNS